MNTPETRPGIKRGWVRALLLFPSWLIAQASFLLAVFFIVELFDEFLDTGDWLSDVVLDFGGSGDYMALSTMILTQIVEVAATVFAIVMLRRLVDGRSVRSLGLSVEGWLKHFWAGAAVGAIAIAAGFLFLWAMGALTVTPQPEGVRWTEIVVGFVLFILVAINEELIVRGYLLANLCASMNRYMAVAITSVVFGALHLFNFNLSFIGILNIALAGAVFGLYYARFGNLLFPIGLHLTWNFFQGPVFGFGVSGFQTDSIIGHTASGPAWMTGGSFGLEGSIVASVLELLMIAGILVWGRLSNLEKPRFV